MPSLISATEKAVLTGIFGDIFDTFARSIIVYKEPIKTAVPSVSSSNMIYGFGESQGEDTYVYTEVTGVFPAVIRYKEQGIEENPEINAYISNGEVTIKVKRDCRDFIMTDKTEKIGFDNRTFILDGDERKQMFLDSEFYIFKLKATK